VESRYLSNAGRGAKVSRAGIQVFGYTPGGVELRSSWLSIDGTGWVGVVWAHALGGFGPRSVVRARAPVKPGIGECAPGTALPGAALPGAHSRNAIPGRHSRTVIPGPRSRVDYG